MNCRPGDLARVLAPGRRIACPLCDRSAIAVKADTLVIVTEHVDGAWVLKDPVPFNVSIECGAHITGVCKSLEDRHLKPIRDPGDDAVDEVLVRVGAPAFGEVAHG